MSDDASVTVESAQQPQQQSQQRPRTDWYQTDVYVSVSVFVKGVAQDTASGVVAGDGREVTVSYEVAGSTARHSLKLSLSHPVAADSVQLSVKPTRLDLRLSKVTPGLRWSVLEGQDSSAPTPAAVASLGLVSCSDQPAVLEPQLQHKPQPAKNWDAIAKSIEDEKLEGDAALNNLFQQIFQDGSDEQRRAMVKSFTESGGTVLSTNWNEVGKGKVDIKPPDGMEYKKWD